MTSPRVQTLPRTGDVGPDAPAVHVVTFGCQMNKYDSLLAEGRFLAEGYRLTDAMEDADVVLFNSCSVREHAEERVFSWLGELRGLRARRPELVVGVMGCMAQRVEDGVFARSAQVDLVCGTRRFQHLPALVAEVRERRASGGPRSTRVLDVDTSEDVRVDRSDEPYTGGLTGYLAVMRGCDLNCTFCIVPTVRGRVRSRPIDELVREAKWMVAGGARVITLLGQTIDAYGEDLHVPGPGEEKGSGRRGRPGLADLLRALQDVPGLARIRLVTLHPAYVTPALARAIAECDKVDRFLPLPVQSGSDAVLRRMRRGYTTALYRDRVQILRAEVPDIELGSDWIVGFPGETEADFERSLAFLEEIGFSQSYVFKYDPRPGTRAHELADDVPTAEKKERNRRLLSAAERVALGRNRRWLGRETEAFVEDALPQSGPKVLRARTRHNTPVRLAGPSALVGRSVTVRLEEASAFGVAGTLVTPVEAT